MSYKIRRPLAVVAALFALFLTLPAPSQAVALWEWQPATVVARAWSWLEGLGLMPLRVERKEGSMVEPDGRTSPSSSSTTDEGSMIEPDGRK